LLPTGAGVVGTAGVVGDVVDAGVNGELVGVDGPNGAVVGSCPPLPHGFVVPPLASGSLPPHPGAAKSASTSRTAMTERIADLLKDTTPSLLDYARYRLSGQRTTPPHVA